MMTSLPFNFASRSHPGMVRTHNEDALALVPTVGLFILADGMGGYKAGEVASGMATALLSSELTEDLRAQEQGRTNLFKPGEEGFHQLLRNRVDNANHVIYNAAAQQSQYEGMGTTLVMLVLQTEHATVAHLGDSRCYRLRGETFEQLTRDHSLLQEQMDAGLLTPEMAKLSNNKSLVTRALGVELEIELEVHDYPVSPGDVYLLCSDGLSDMLADEDIKLTLSALSNNLELAAQMLVQMANDAGGRDNVSVILVKVKPDPTPAEGVLARFANWLK
jgi:serine/threonine protein phosphatase PrpC